MFRRVFNFIRVFDAGKKRPSFLGLVAPSHGTSNLQLDPVTQNLNKKFFGKPSVCLATSALTAFLIFMAPVVKAERSDQSGSDQALANSVRDVSRGGPSYSSTLLGEKSSQKIRPQSGSSATQGVPAGKSPEGDQELKGSGAVSDQEAAILGTAPLSQSAAAYRLFGDSGWTLNQSTVFSHKLYESANPQFDQAYSYSFGVGYNFSDDYYSSLTMSLGHNPNHYDEKEQLLIRNTSLSFSRAPLILGRYFLTPNLSFRLPVGREAVLRESLVMGVSPSASLGLPPFWSGSRLRAAYSVSLTYNFHEYTYSTRGQPNNRSSVSQGVSVSYPLVRDLFLRVGGSHSLLWSTLGNAREYWGHTQELSWAITPNANLSVGHSNQGSLYALNGVDYEFSFLNQRNSIFFGRLNLSI